VVENRPGASGTIATRQVAKGEPDGYTLVVGNTATLSIAPSMMPNIGYDPRKDFAPIGLIAATAQILIVHPTIPAHSLQDMIALAKKDPGKLSYASAGTGTPSHLAGELFQTMANVKLTHVPYRGLGAAMADVMGGHVPVSFSTIPPAVGLIRDNKVRTIAITSAKRHAGFPDIPTFSEAGLPGYSSEQRYGILAPARTPRPIVDKLNAALREALASPDVQTRIAAEGAVPEPGTPDDYARDIDTEETKWSAVVRQAGVKVE
jgi:tripartite-type tricarboxylate transporter receptor subunit TctC